jgi:hypothetical protein
MKNRRNKNKNDAKSWFLDPSTSFRVRVHPEAGQNTQQYRMYCNKFEGYFPL